MAGALRFLPLAFPRLAGAAAAAAAVDDDDDDAAAVVAAAAVAAAAAAAVAAGVFDVPFAARRRAWAWLLADAAAAEAAAVAWWTAELGMTCSGTCDTADGNVGSCPCGSC